MRANRAPARHPSPRPSRQEVRPCPTPSPRRRPPPVGRPRRPPRGRRSRTWTPSCGRRWRRSVIARRTRSSSSRARTTSTRRCSRRRARGSPTSTPRACPGKRYYGGCEYVDIAENLARDRALALFPGADHVNVQPHSGRPGQHGGLLRGPQAGRPDPGHEPRPRRPPHPRLAGELLGPPVRGARVRGHPRGRADRLRRPRGAGGRGPAQGHRRGGVRLSADVGLRAAGGDRPRRRRPAVRRHGPRRRARRRRVAPEPVPARRPRHHHHPQDAARAAWRRGVRSRGPARGRRSRRLPRARQEHAGAGRSTSPCSPASRAAR